MVTFDVADPENKSDKRYELTMVSNFQPALILTYAFNSTGFPKTKWISQATILIAALKYKL